MGVVGIAGDERERDSVYNLISSPDYGYTACTLELEASYIVSRVLLCNYPTLSKLKQLPCLPLPYHPDFPTTENVSLDSCSLLLRMSKYPG